MSLPTPGPDEQDTANAWAYLLGGVAVDNFRDPGTNDVPPHSPGLLRRLVQSFQGDPIGPSQRFATVATATGLTIPDRANSATLSVETNSIRVYYDGTVPTATNGLLITTGVLVTITGRKSLTGFQMIEAAAHATVNVVYWT